MRRILSCLLCLMLVAALAVPAFAANVPYEFYLTNTGTNFRNANPFKTNTKVLPNDPATIYCSFTDAPGWGYYMRLSNNQNSVCTYSYWYNNSNKLRHPTYTDPSHSDQKDYFIEGRIDNDYWGTYKSSGVFNADYTNP